MNSVAEHYSKYPYPKPDPYMSYGRMLRFTGVGTLTPHNVTGMAYKNLLVVGCGTISGLWAARDNPHLDVTGIDLSEPSLEWSRKQAKIEGIDNIQLIQADICDWRPNVKYDAIFASCVLHHIPNINGALSNIRSLLNRDHSNPFVWGHVYRKKSRGHIPQTIKKMKAHGIDDIPAVKQYLESLSEYHPSRRWYEKYQKHDIELADTWLNPHFVNYSVHSWTQELGKAGFTHVMLPTPDPRPLTSLMGFQAWDRS